MSHHRVPHHRDRQVPRYLVERLVKGELSEPQAQALRARLEQEPGGLQRARDDLQASDDAILAAYPCEPMAAQIRQRVQSGGRSRHARSLLLPALALGTLGGLVLLALRPGPRGLEGPPAGVVVQDEETIRLKGLAPHLLIYRKHRDTPQVLKAGDSVRPGDVLQLAYVMPADPTGAPPPFGALISVDTKRSTTLHWPARPGPAARVETKGEARLPSAFELDDSPGFERFVFVTSPHPFHTKDVTSALRDGTPLAQEFNQIEMTLIKELP